MFGRAIPAAWSRLRVTVPAPSNDGRRLSDTCVLVVEDDRDIRAMTVTVLEGAGAEVTTASSATEALELVGSRRFDAVVLDWHLADMTGSTLLHSLRANYPDLFARSAVVTGDLMSIPGQHEAESFGRPVLAKPFRPKQLISTVSGLLA